MQLKSTKILLINIFVFLGYADIVHADECGVLHYLANKSSGVTVTDNTCKIVDDIALGSDFNLMPGARLWFKSQMGTDTKMQVICQNRSPGSVRINVDNLNLPWIKPVGLANCSLWTDNKMDCDESIGGQNTLSCVMASVDSRSAAPKEIEERTTSIKMRSLIATDVANKIEPLQKTAQTGKERIVSAMQPDIDLCKAVNHSYAHIMISWVVGTNGQVNTVIPVVDGSIRQNDADTDFIDCLKAVIKSFPYPQSSQAVWLSNQF